MPPLFIFIYGAFITLILVGAVIMVGINEAKDSEHTREEDLSTWEKPLVKEDQKRAKD